MGVDATLLCGWLGAGNGLYTDTPKLAETPSASPPYPVRCAIEAMRVTILANVRAAMTEIAHILSRQRGKASAKNVTPEERSARAKKASSGGSGSGQQIKSSWSGYVPLL